MQGRAGRELGAEPAQVGEPWRGEPVGEVAVRAVVGEVGGEDAAGLVRERPERVGGRLGRPEVGHGQRDVAELDRLAIGHDLGRERALAAPTRRRTSDAGSAP